MTDDDKANPNSECALATTNTTDTVTSPTAKYTPQNQDKIDQLSRLLAKTEKYSQYLCSRIGLELGTGIGVPAAAAATSPPCAAVPPHAASPPCAPSNTVSAATAASPVSTTMPAAKRKGKACTSSQGKGKAKGKGTDNLKEALSQAAAPARMEYLQPPNVTGGELRNYQLEGLNWLIQLFENGMNGVLADEMGLGKTIICISFLAHLWYHRVYGPFLIVAPLSTLANWCNEFQKWAPTIPVELYHGSKDARLEMRSKWRSRDNTSKRRKVDEGDEVAVRVMPIIVTSYDIAINDRKFLQPFQWKYLVVDEAHRLKNFNCKLVCELRMLNTEGRLLMTGTPLQNNLAELWSLLNFLLPELFDDLESFKNWFDFTDLLEAHEHQESATPTALHQDLVSKLHNVLRPFLLRRRKQDVELSIPSKVEIVLHAPFTHNQRILYTAVKNKTLGNSRPISLNNLIMHLRKVCNHSFLFGKDVIRAVLEFANEEESFAQHEKEEVVTELPRLRPRVASTVYEEVDSDFDDDSDEDDPGGSKQRNPKQKTSVAKKDPAQKIPKSAYNLYCRERWAQHKQQQQIKSQQGQQDKMDWAETSALTSSFARDWSALPVEEKEVYKQRLEDERMACENLTREDDEMEPEKRLAQMIEAGGKMTLLHKMLPVLKAKGHKVLIFSQMTRMLDIIEDYLDLVEFRYCRIDGSIKQTDRQDQINSFNSDPEVFIFLLSTRAGGVGINLAAADTVIIYDSDWNPQMDLQAQDRCHRIGQKRNVVVYRLITANSVESHILRRARSKLVLERLVVEKGGFSSRGRPKSTLTNEDIVEILKTEAVGVDERCVSDKDLEVLLDREKVFAEHKQKRQRQAQAQQTIAPQPSETNTQPTPTMAAVATPSVAPSAEASSPPPHAPGFEFVEHVVSQF